MSFEFEDLLDNTQKEEARGWINDCMTGEEDFDGADELTDYQIVKMVDRYYDGGLSQFRTNSTPSYPSLTD